MIGSDAVPFTDPHGFACVSVGVGELVDPLAGGDEQRPMPGLPGPDSEEP